MRTPNPSRHLRHRSATGARRRRRWAGLFAVALAGLIAGCSRPPSLPYDLTGLDTAALSPAGIAPAGTTAAPARPAAVPRNVVRLVVSLPQQRLFVYRGGALIATSAVSTGKRGHATPVGTFRILQKQVHHRSNRYSNAPMPYVERLTESGIALHAGHLPGYPASHGCIRMPLAFAKRLYRMTSFQSSVTITRARVRTAKAT